MKIQDYRCHPKFLWHHSQPEWNDRICCIKADDKLTTADTGHCHYPELKELPSEGRQHVQAIHTRLCNDQFGNLDGIGGGTFAQLVAAAPQVQAAGIGQVLAKPTNQYQILCRGIQWHRILQIL